ncbi:MAG TPA: cytochrome C oxidase subunit IV family protein [Sphingomicrobium sp.]|jgi:cytochrome c oxidase subunit 4|nr:cytochrome C oxidase subunit IV family protein [Sphingomicrobium sp.]
MSAATIWRCWLALILLLAATTASAFVPLGSANIVISLGIAAAKALIVLLFFMELRASRALVRTFAAAGFFWLLIMIVLTGADYWHRTDALAPIDRVR